MIDNKDKQGTTFLTTNSWWMYLQIEDEKTEMVWNNKMEWNKIKQLKRQKKSITDKWRAW